jgi:hypothetical protein
MRLGSDVARCWQRSFDMLCYQPCQGLPTAGSNPSLYCHQIDLTRLFRNYAIQFIDQEIHVVTLPPFSKCSCTGSWCGGPTASSTQWS